MSADGVAGGERIADRYRLLEEIGRGGMGSVHVAQDEKFGTRVALKLAATAGADFEQFQARFAREARIGNLLGRAEGFVRALDWGALPDGVRLYLAMDLVEGARPLDLRSGAVPARVRRLARAARIVAQAHAQGIVHRDLKPANVLQAPDGSLHVADFGLAKAPGEGAGAAPSGPALTQSGVGMGTPVYMAPEQFEDAARAGTRADVYSLGVMLFEALTGAFPYPSREFRALWIAHQRVRDGSQPAPRARDLAPEVPAALDALCAEAMALEPDARPECADWVEALDAALDGLAAKGSAAAAGAAGNGSPDASTVDAAADDGANPEPATLDAPVGPAAPDGGEATLDAPVGPAAPDGGEATLDVPVGAADDAAPAGDEATLDPRPGPAAAPGPVPTRQSVFASCLLGVLLLGGALVPAFQAPAGTRWVRVDEPWSLPVTLSSDSPPLFLATEGVEAAFDLEGLDPLPASATHRILPEPDADKNARGLLEVDVPAVEAAQAETLLGRRGRFWATIQLSHRASDLLVRTWEQRAIAAAARPEVFDAREVEVLRSGAQAARAALAAGAKRVVLPSQVEERVEFVSAARANGAAVWRTVRIVLGAFGMLLGLAGLGKVSTRAEAAEAADAAEAAGA